MKYWNSKTGAVIDAACEISGGNWEPVPEEGTGVQPEPARKSRKKSAAKAAEEDKADNAGE
jgi:hypothetical protein